MTTVTAATDNAIAPTSRPALAGRKGLCAWFSERAGDEAVPALQRMLAAAGAASQGSSAMRSDAQAALAVFGGAPQLHVHEAGGFWLAAIGHPRLNSASGRSASLADMAAALRERGRAALADFGGDFALVAWDGVKRRGLAAVDRLGIHPLVYARSAGTVAFASTADAVAAAPTVGRRLSHQAVFDYFYYHVCPGPGTAFDGLQRIAPAHCVEFGAGVSGEAAPYWSLRFREDNERTFGDFKQEFRSLLEAAVKEASTDAPGCGSFLSGGTDSSTVSGMLTRVSGKPAQAFSIGFDSQGFDETGYARIAARHFGLQHREYYVTPQDVVDAVPAIAASYDQPFGNASAIPTYYCARFAREHGITRLLAGDGGDELFGGNDRYALQYLLSLYGGVPTLLRRLIEPVLESAPGIGSVMPLRKLRGYVRQAKPEMPWRYESYNLLQHLGAANVLTPEFLSTIDAQHPRGLLRDAFAPFAGDSLINQMLGIDYRFTLTDNDLPKVSQMCALAGVDVAFPLLDDRLIEFSARLPSQMKLRRTQLRWFFKEALADFLPEEIIRKKKHGFGLPVGQWLQSHRPLFDLAVSGATPLVARGIVRRAFVDELVDTRMKENPEYYGVMLWMLMMLGLWLESRQL